MVNRDYIFTTYGIHDRSWRRKSKREAAPGGGAPPPPVAQRGEAEPSAMHRASPSDAPVAFGGQSISRSRPAEQTAFSRGLDGRRLPLCATFHLVLLL